MDHLKLATTLIYNYKFSNKALEPTLLGLLKLAEISSDCLGHKEKEDKLLEITQILVDYKFNKILLPAGTMAKDILELLALNKTFLDAYKKKYGKYDLDDWT